MNLEFTPYALPFIISAVITIITAIYAWPRHKSGAGTALVMMAILLAWWTATYAVEIMAVDLADKLFWYKRRYVGMTFVPYLWMVFALRYVNPTPLRGLSNLRWLVLAPITFTLLAFTNDWHGLLWEEAKLVASDGFTALQFSFNTVFWIHYGLAALFMIVGGAVLLYGLWTQKGLPRYQQVALLIGALLPSVSQILFRFGFGLVDYLDLTPALFSLTAVAFAVATHGRGLRDVAQYARQRIIQEMSAGFIVINDQGVVADINETAAHIIGVPRNQALGQKAIQLLTPWPHLHALVDSAAPTADFLTFGRGAGQQQYVAQFTPLAEGPQQLYLGQLLTLQPVGDAPALASRPTALAEPTAANTPLALNPPTVSYSFLQPFANFFFPPPLPRISVRVGESPRFKQLLEQAFTSMLRFAFVFFFLGLFTTAPYLLEGDSGVVIPFTVAVALLGVLAIGRPIPFVYRGVGFLFILYFAAVAELANYGYSLELFIFLMIITVIGTLTQGTWWGVILLVGNTALLVFAGWQIAQGNYHPLSISPTGIAPPPNFDFALAAISVFITSSTIVMAAIATLTRGVNLAWQEESQAQNLLRQERDTLDQRVAERTGQLQKSEASLRSFIQASPAIIMQVDAEGDILFAHIPGMNPEQLQPVLGQSILSVSPPETHADIQQALATVFADQKAVQYQAQGIDHEGNPRIYLTNVAPVISEGQVASAITLATDITSRVEAEKQLEQRERILEAIAASSTQLLQTARWQDVIDTVLVQLGQAAEASRIYIFEKHFSPENILLSSQRYEWVAEGITSEMDNPNLHNMPFNEFVPRWVNHFEKGLLVSGLVSSFPDSEREILDPQNIISLVVIPIMVRHEWWGFIGFDECAGERVWSTAEIEVLRAAANNLGAAIERQQQEMALVQTAERLAEAQAIGHIGGWEWDIPTKTATWSTESYRLFGISEADRDKPAFELFYKALHPNDVKAEQAATAQVLRGEPYDLEYRIFWPNGQLRYLHAIAQLITNKNGDPLRVTGVVQDITERKEAELALNQLYHVMASAYTYANERLTNALKVGAELLRLPLGIISRIEGNSYVVLHTLTADGALQLGQEYHFPETICAITYQTDDLVAIEHMGQSVYKNHPCYEMFGLESYIGVPLYVEGQRFGTLNFSSPAVRQTPFTPAEKEFLLLMGQWVSAEVERQLAAQKLANSEEQFRTLVSNIPGISYRCLADEQWTMLFMSDGGQEITGYPAADFINNQVRAFSDCIYPADRQYVSDMVAQGSQNDNGLVFEMEYRLIHADGRIRWVREKGRAVYDVDGALRHLDGAIFDITDRKQTEEQQKAILAAIPDFLFRFDKAGTFLDYHSPTGNTLLLPPETFIGRQIGEVLPPQVTEPFTAALQQAAEADQLVQFEYQLDMLGGQRIFEARVTAVNETEFLALVRDVTERAQARQELIEINQQLDQFAYIVSHDLKAPLRAIANLSTWIEEDLGEELPGDAAENMILLRQRVDFMRSMIDGVLAYSRAGRQTSSVEQVDLDAALRQVLAMLDAPAFTITVANPLPTIRGERFKLEQLFSNLIGNSVKYHHRSDGRIQISCADQNDYWEFAVADDGPGIDSAYHDKIFDLFHTVEANQEADSTGVGLAIARKIVEERGGRIWVESAPGAGATFHFTWSKE